MRMNRIVKMNIIGLKDYWQWISNRRFHSYKKRMKKIQKMKVKWRKKKLINNKRKIGKNKCRKKRRLNKRKFNKAIKLEC